jgi:hypothetical protein
LIQEEMRGKGIEVPESSSEAEDNEDADDEEEGSGEEGGDGSSSSDDGDDDGAELVLNMMTLPRRLTSPAEMLEHIFLKLL